MGGRWPTHSRINCRTSCRRITMSICRMSAWTNLSWSWTCSSWRIKSPCAAMLISTWRRALSSQAAKWRKKMWPSLISRKLTTTCCLSKASTPTRRYCPNSHRSTRSTRASPRASLRCWRPWTQARCKKWTAPRWSKCASVWSLTSCSHSSIESSTTTTTCSSSRNSLRSAMRSTPSSPMSLTKQSSWSYRS